MLQRGLVRSSVRLQSRMKVNFFFFWLETQGAELYIESGCLEQLKVDVAAWAGQVLGTSPVEDEG